MAISDATKQIVKVNFVQSNAQVPVLYLSQYDTGDGRTIYFDIYDNAQAFTIPSGLTVTFEGTKPDGKGFSFGCRYSGNRVFLASYTKQMTAVAGITYAQLVFVNSGGGRIGTIPIIMHVSKAGISDDTVLSNSEIAAIVAAQEQYATLMARFNSAITAVSSSTELTDIRVKADGTTAASAGDAVRGQIRNLQTQINEIITSTGEAPSAEEVKNARIGADGIAYSILGDAIRKPISKINSAIEELNDKKEQITNSITEINEGMGDIDDDINAVKLRTTVLEQKTYGFVTPQMYGAKGDGITDDTDAVQAALDSENVVFFPAGTYLVNRTLQIKQSIYGVSAPRLSGKGSVIKCGFNTADYLAEYIISGDSNGITIRNVAFDCQSVSGGILYAPTSGRPTLVLDNVSVWDFGTIGINIAPAEQTSRAAMMSNLSLTGGSETAECGIRISGYALDCALENFMVMYCKKGVLAIGGGLRMEQGHIYVGRANLQDIDAYYETSICVEAAASIIANNIYVDSALQGWLQRAGASIIGNLYAYYDTFADSATNKNAVIVRTVNDANHVNIGQLFVGGNQKVIGRITDGNVKVSNVMYRWSDLPTAENGYSYGLIPYILPNIGRNRYEYKHIGQNISAVAAVYVNGQGNAIIRISRRTMVLDVVISSDGTSITVKKYRVYGLPSTALYYKIVDKYVYIYTYAYQTVAVDYSLTNSGDMVCGVDLTAYTDLPVISQTNLDGLTEVPYGS